jgi:hypothetical protein
VKPDINSRFTHNWVTGYLVVDGALVGARSLWPFFLFSRFKMSVKNWLQILGQKWTNSPASALFHWKACFKPQLWMNLNWVDIGFHLGNLFGRENIKKSCLCMLCKWVGGCAKDLDSPKLFCTSLSCLLYVANNFHYVSSIMFLSCNVWVSAMAKNYIRPKRDQKVCRNGWQKKKKKELLELLWLT